MTETNPLYAEIERLKAQNKELYDILVSLILQIHKHEKCGVCDGKGERPLLNIMLECEFCHGTGFNISTGRGIAIILKMRQEYGR